MGKEPFLRVQASSFSHPKAGLLARLQRHPLVCGMSLLFPVFPREGEEAVGSAAEAVVRETAARLEPLCGRFFSVTGPLYAFLDSAFLDQHVRAPAAEFFLLSRANPADDRQDITAITPTGLLQMVVTKETFQQLGIPGKRSMGSPGDIYHISIDLRAASFRQGKPLHDRVVLCLRRNPFPLHFTCCFAKDGRSMRPSFPSPVTVLEDASLTPSHWSSAADLPTGDFFQALARTVTQSHSSANTTVPHMGTESRSSADTSPSLYAPPSAGDRNAREGPGLPHRDTSGSSVELEGASGHAMEAMEEEGEGGEGDGLEGGGAASAPASGPRDASGDAPVLLSLFHWLGLMCCDLPLLQGHLRTATQELREAAGAPRLPGGGITISGTDCDTLWSAGEIHRLNLKGPLTPLQILGALTAAQELTGTRGVLPWCALATWGFRATPEDCTDSRRAFKAGHSSSDSCLVLCGEDRFMHFLCE